MALFGSNFATGFVKGLAESVDERLKDDMDRTFDRVDRAADYHIRRRAEEEDRYNQEMEDVESVLNELASFTDGDYDKAAQLYKHGGSTVAGGQNLIQTLSTSRAELGSDFNTNSIIEFAENQTGGYSVGDYLDVFVNRPEEFASAQLPEDATQGVGLYQMFKPDVSGQIERQVREVFPESDRGEKPTIEVGTATIDYGKLPTAMEYKKKMTLTDLQIQEAEADIQAALTAADMENALSFNEFRSLYTDTVAPIANQADIPIDAAGNFDLQTAADKIDNLSDVMTQAIQTTVQQGANAKGTFALSGNISTIVGRASLKDSGGNYYINISPLPTTSDGKLDADKLEIGRAYFAIDPTTNKKIPKLYFGQDSGGFIDLYGN
jgi:hypothetical protein